MIACIVCVEETGAALAMILAYWGMIVSLFRRSKPETNHDHECPSVDPYYD